MKSLNHPNLPRSRSNCRHAGQILFGRRQTLIFELPKNTEKHISPYSFSSVSRNDNIFACPCLNPNSSITIPPARSTSIIIDHRVDGVAWVAARTRFGDRIGATHCPEMAIGHPISFSMQRCCKRDHGREDELESRSLVQRRKRRRSRVVESREHGARARVTQGASRRLARVIT